MLRYFERQIQSVFPVVNPAEARAYLEHFSGAGIPLESFTLLYSHESSTKVM